MRVTKGAIAAYEKKNWHHIVVARKMARLIEQLRAAHWKPSPKTDADQRCEFLYQSEGWGHGPSLPGAVL